MALTKSQLHNYQLACVDHIISHNFCGVFLEMGLGKTVSTLTAIEALMFDYLEVKSVLVIAPKRVAETVWEEEAAKWEHLQHLTFSKIIGTQADRFIAFKRPANIHIISRDNVAWLCTNYGPNLPYDMIVVDELSSFKSYKSLRFKALRASRPYTKRLVGLTGTPAPNGLIDLWPQIWLMDMGARLEKTISKYRETYFVPGYGSGHIVFKYVPKPGADDIIYEKIGDICMSMKSSDYLSMPLCTYNNIELRLTPELQKQYDDFEKESVLDFIDGQDEGQINAVNAAGLMNKLLQFANGAVYESKEGGERITHPIHDIKIDALDEIMDTNPDKSILVAWSFQSDRDRIMKAMSKYKPRELKTAKDINDWNAGEVRLMLAHPASAGHGLNLQSGGHIIVWFGLTWSLELYQQFNARLFRQGQTEHVIIHHLIMQKTSDADVLKAINNKSTMQNALMESVKARIEKYKFMMR